MNDRPQGRSPTLLVLADGTIARSGWFSRPRWCSHGGTGHSRRPVLRVVTPDLGKRRWACHSVTVSQPACYTTCQPASAKYACSADGKLPLTCRLIYGCYQGRSCFIFPFHIPQVQSRDQQSLCGLLPLDQNVKMAGSPTGTTSKGDETGSTDEKVATTNVEDSSAPRLQAPEFVRSLSPEDREILEKKLKRKIDLRLLPAIIIMYIMNYIDRCVYTSPFSSGLFQRT